METRCLGFALVAWLHVAASAAEETPRPDLRGEVVDTGGKPVAGATVFVYTARFRRGTSPY